ncbi:MAG: hypothetical protein AB7W59_00175 [Acidimicrobiia bacterium]
MENVQTSVVVHKASLPLMDGESIHDYNGKLQDAAKAHIRQKLNLSSKDEVWGVETFGDSAIFSIWLADNTITTKPRHRYYSVEYTRDSEGKFSFSATTEVQRVTTFQPVAPVAKAEGAEPAPADPVEVERVHKAAWERPRFWGGVL